jgi:hypothetical protein
MYYSPLVITYLNFDVKGAPRSITTTKSRTSWSTIVCCPRRSTNASKRELAKRKLRRPPPRLCGRQEVFRALQDSALEASTPLDASACRACPVIREREELPPPSSPRTSSSSRTSTSKTWRKPQTTKPRSFTRRSTLERKSESRRY